LKKIDKILENPVEIFESYEIVKEKSVDLDIKKDEYDFFELAYQALENDINFWQVGEILIKLIPFSKLQEDNVLKLLKYLYEKDTKTSIHFYITQQLVKVDENLSKSLLNKLLQIKENFCIAHIGAILVELHNTYKINQLEIVLKYLESNDEFKLKCIIGNIHLYKFNDNEIHIIFEKFKNLIGQSIEID
jgi:hypothetical protein